MIDCTKTENYFAEKRRMTMATRLSAKWGVCKLSCKECPLFITNNGIGDSCTNLEIHYPKKAVEIIQKWSDEHPPKTYLSEFLKYYPNAQLRTDGTPNFCPYRLGLSDIDECSETHNCIKCWNQPVKESEGK
jgi:hypothetical protein|nr:MAG TPA: hypothetical protein [Caudoviricetes sp.]